MKQVRTTIILSAFAVASLFTALSVYYFAPNEEDGQNELIGEVFYPEFTDPVQASSLKLIVWDGKDKKTIEFDVKKVKQKRTVDGEEKEVVLWAIPDHNNYPVESPERLRETAGSIMNIERLSLASNAKEEHERLGVVNPYDENAKLKEPNEVGDRIILKDDSDNTVCDLIIGKAVDAETENEIGADKRDLVKGDRYYVRQPDENETYIAQLDLQITTDFSEWIDDDLLQIKEATVSKIQFLNYDVEKKLIEKFGGMVPVRQNYEEFIVQKENGTWNIDDLKSDTEELDTAPLNSLENEFRSLSILEVEPKPTYQDNDMKILNADLTVNAPPGMSRNDQIRIQSQVLGPQGFIVGLEDEKKVSPSLLSTNGELKVATDEGLVYHLFFGYDVRLQGESFEFANKEEKENEDEKKKADDGNNDEKKDDKIRNGKIMSVHVTFDPDLIEKPTAPVKPVKPERPDLGLPLPGKSGDEDKGQSAKQPDAGGDKKPAKKKADPPKSNTDGPKKKTETEPKKDAKDKVSFEPAESNESSFYNVSVLTQQEKEQDQEKGKAPGKEKAAEKKGPNKATPKKTKSEPKKTPAKDQEKEKAPPKKKEAPAPSKQEKNGKATKAPGKQDPGKQDPGKQEPGKQEPGKQEQKEPMKTPEQIFTEKMAAYDQAMTRYEADLARYEAELKDYEKALDEYKKKIEDNRKKVAQLNSRFADWFYIVDAADLEKVKLSRAALVKPKPKTPNQPPRGLPPGFNLPGGNPLPNLNNLPGKDLKGAEKSPKGSKDASEPKKSSEGPGKSEKKTEKTDKKPGAPKKAADPEKSKVDNVKKESSADPGKPEIKKAKSEGGKKEDQGKKEKSKS